MGTQTRESLKDLVMAMRGGSLQVAASWATDHELLCQQQHGSLRPSVNGCTYKAEVVLPSSLITMPIYTILVNRGACTIWQGELKLRPPSQAELLAGQELETARDLYSSAM